MAGSGDKRTWNGLKKKIRNVSELDDTNQSGDLMLLRGLEKKVAAAYALTVEASYPKLSKVEIEHAMKVLLAANVIFPPATHLLVRSRARHCGASGDHAELMATRMPWSNTPFDPLIPCLGSAAKPPQKRIQDFTNVVIKDMLVPQLLKGEDQAEAAVKLVAQLEQTLSEVDIVDLGGIFVGVLSKTLFCAHAILEVCGTDFGNPNKADVYKLRQTWGLGQKSIIGMVCEAMAGSADGFWQRKVDMYAQTCVYMGEIYEEKNEADARLQHAAQCPDTCELEPIQEIARKLGCWAAGSRAGALRPTTRALEDVLALVWKSLSTVIEKGGDEILGEVQERIKAAGPVVREMTLLDPTNERYHDWMDTIGSWLRRGNEQSRMRFARTALSTIANEIGREEVELSNLRERLCVVEIESALKQMKPEDSDEVSKRSAKTFVDSASALILGVIGGPEAEAVLGLVRNALVLCPSVAAKQRCDICVAARNALAADIALTNLGDSNTQLLQVSGALAAVQALERCAKALSDKLAGTDQEHLEGSTKASLDRLTNSANDRLKVYHCTHVASLGVVYENCRTVLAGCGGGGDDGSSWFATLGPKGKYIDAEAILAKVRRV